MFRFQSAQIKLLLVSSQQRHSQQQQYSSRSSGGGGDPSRKFTAQITRAHSWEDAIVAFNEAMEYTSTTTNEKNPSSSSSSSLHQYWIRALLRRCGRAHWSTCLKVYSQLSTSNNINDNKVMRTTMKSISPEILHSDTTRAALAYGTLINWKVALAFSLSTPSLVESELKPLGLKSNFYPLPLPCFSHHQSSSSSSSLLPIFDIALRGASQAGAWEVCLNLFQLSGLEANLRYKDFVAAPTSSANRNHRKDFLQAAGAASSFLVFARVALSTMIALVGYQQKYLMWLAIIQEKKNVATSNEQRKKDFLLFADRLYTSFVREMNQLSFQVSNAELSLMRLRFHTTYCFILSSSGEGQRALQVCEAAPWEIQEDPKRAFPTEDVMGLVSKTLTETRWSVMLKALMNCNATNQRRSVFSSSTTTDGGGEANNQISSTRIGEATAQVAQYVMNLRKEENEIAQNESRNLHGRRNHHHHRQQQQKSAISTKALMWERTFCIEAFSHHNHEFTSSSSSSSSSSSTSALRQTTQKAIDTWFLSVCEALDNPRLTETMRMRYSLSLAEVLRSLSVRAQQEKKKQHQQQEKVKEDDLDFVSWKAALHAHSLIFENKETVEVVSITDQYKLWLCPILCVIAENPNCPREISRRALESALEKLRHMFTTTDAQQSQTQSQSIVVGDNNSTLNKNESFVCLLRCLINRSKYSSSSSSSSYMSQNYEQGDGENSSSHFLPIPSLHIKSTFFKPKREETSTFFKQNQLLLIPMATEEDFDTLLTNNQKNIYRQYHSLENFCIPLFRDAPWVFFSQILLCLELKSPSIKAEELNQRWKMALRAFDQWKTHEFLNFNASINNHNCEKEKMSMKKFLLDVVDLEDASDSSSYSSLSSSVKSLFEKYDVSLVSTMKMIESWLKSHGQEEILLSPYFSSQLPAVHHIDEILSHQIEKELKAFESQSNNSKLSGTTTRAEIVQQESDDENETQQEKLMTSTTENEDKHQKMNALKLSENLFSKSQDIEDDFDNGADAATRIQQQLLRQAHKNMSSSTNNSEVSSLLLQTAVALRKRQNNNTGTNNNENSSSLLHRQENQNHPNFVSGSSSSTSTSEVWNEVLIQRAIKSGTWQHAHFLFLRSLHTLSLQHQCEFVEFELERTSREEREKSLMNIKKSSKDIGGANNNSSSSSSTALQAVALAIIPKLANKTSLTKNDQRNLPFAARVGAESFLRCGMWRSALKFVQSTLGLSSSILSSSSSRIGSEEEQKEKDKIVELLLSEEYGGQQIPWGSLVVSLSGDGADGGDDYLMSRAERGKKNEKLLKEILRRGK